VEDAVAHRLALLRPHPAPNHRLFASIARG
jgi:hypothetical protein